jgi:hypothetical protein
MLKRRAGNERQRGENRNQRQSVQLPAAEGLKKIDPGSEHDRNGC